MVYCKETGMVGTNSLSSALRTVYACMYYTPTSIQRPEISHAPALAAWQILAYALNT